LTESELDILAAKIAKKVSLQPRWLKLKQAASYASIGQKEIVSLIKQKKIEGMQDQSLKTKPWIVDKYSIDRYRENQIKEYQGNIAADEKIALDIVESLGI